jgi:hypothetical protein
LELDPLFVILQLGQNPGAFDIQNSIKHGQTDGNGMVIFLRCVSSRNSKHDTTTFAITMVLRIGTSSARAPPTSAPPTSLTHQEVACLKTALALVVVKRRLEIRRRPSPLPDQVNDDDDDGNNNSSMEFELETNSSSMTNQLCPWMPLLGSQLTTATAGATSSTSTTWMNHRSTGTGTSCGNGNTNNSAADWVHMDHFMGLALQRAALTFEATTTQQSVNRPHSSNPNDKGPLTALTTHLAHQLVRILHNSRSTNVSGVDAISDWIRSTFLNDSDPTTQSNGKAQSSFLHLQTACIVWHGMLTAQPVELPVVLLPVLVPILKQVLDESTSSTSSSSSAPPSATTMVTNDNDHALYLQLFEHALHKAPPVTVETILEELALTPAQYCWPVALGDLAANYEWKRRRNNNNISGSITANNHATNSHTTAGGALLLRYGMSSILQQTMLAHHSSVKGINGSGSREIGTIAHAR